MADRRAIRLFSEYSAERPLWETGGPQYLLSPDDLGLSEGLTNHLRDWTDLWEKHFHYERPWDSGQNRDSWAEWGNQIAESLQSEIVDFADLSNEFDWTL